MDEKLSRHFDFALTGLMILFFAVRCLRATEVEGAGEVSEINEKTDLPTFQDIAKTN